MGVNSAATQDLIDTLTEDASVQLFRTWNAQTSR